MKEENIIFSFAEDKLYKCINDFLITNTHFLDITQQSLLLKHFSKNSDIRLMPFGGFENAERVVMLFLPYYLEINSFSEILEYFADNPEDNPLTILRVTKDNFSDIGHRDYLGALMGLGLKREMIGDIIVTTKGADVIVLKSVSSYIISELKSAGRATLKVEEISFNDIESTVLNVLEESVNVSSMRIDNIISACFKLSRSDSAEAVLSGSVYVNSLQVLKCDKKINVGDKVVFRTKGKIVVKDISGISKKGRIFLKIDRYS